MPPKKTTTLAERLKAARAKENLSQSQAARKWKLSLRSLQHWEQGRQPRGLYAEAIEKVLRKIEE